MQAKSAKRATDMAVLNKQEFQEFFAATEAIIRTLTEVDLQPPVAVQGVQPIGGSGKDPHSQARAELADAQEQVELHEEAMLVLEAEVMCRMRSSLLHKLYSLSYLA